MTLEILSAEEKFYSGEVDSVIFPGSEGEIKILEYTLNGI
jgi:F0F1-type ATP synthase epsilon subunit